MNGNWEVIVMMRVVFSANCSIISHKETINELIYNYLFVWQIDINKRKSLRGMTRMHDRCAIIKLKVVETPKI